MAEPKLKPCPFCGAKAKLIRMHGERAVSCTNETGCAVLPTTNFMTEDQAVAAWNNRVT